MNEFLLVKSNPYYLIKKHIYEAIKKHSKELNGVVLDFGCGSKPYLSLFPHVKEYIGLDYENEGHDHKNENVDVFYNGEKMPFPDDYFDAVLSSEVFEHIFELNNTIVEINRVMKPNGKILITCPFVWDLHEEPHDFARYTPYALLHLMEKNGFEVMEIERRGSFREVIAQLKIIYLIKNHFLLNLKPLNTWLFNNKYFSIRVFIKRCIAIYYNSFHLRNDGINDDELYLTNVVLARKK